MRTIDDLRAALVSLESEAPAIEDLLVESPRAMQRVERRSRRWVLPTATAGLTIAVVVAVAGLVAVRSVSSDGADTRHTTASPVAGGQNRLLPFRLTSHLPQLTLLDVHAATNPTSSEGTAVLAEYGMEVTINVSTTPVESTRSASASRTAVGSAEGWIDVSCPLRDAPTSSAALSNSVAGSTAPTFNPTCSLLYDSGPWRVAIYVAGPGGGSRKITKEQFLQIGDRLQLADSPGDTSTWFAAAELLPK